MKIEIGESLFVSWLKHIKECQLVQTNWKASQKWELKNKETLEKLMRVAGELFAYKYRYDIFKGNRSVNQLIGQAEIDVLGVSFEENHKHLYAIDVAFHEAGLNYGSKDETVARIIKKCLRTAMCLYGYFGLTEGTIIFASPKIHSAVEQSLLACLEDMNRLLKEIGIHYSIRIIGNSSFAETILEPVLNVLDDVADTSELFMRSLQMYNLFAERKPKQTMKQQPMQVKRVSRNLEVIESAGIERLKEMKIGLIVRTILRKRLEENRVSKEEIELMQTKEYSKKTFDIQFPLLQKAALTKGEKPARYYSTPLNIYGENYFLCSEWYEVPANNDRPYLIKWLTLNE
jgi:hypothetical protein